MMKLLPELISRIKSGKQCRWSAPVKLLRERNIDVRIRLGQLNGRGPLK